MLRDSSMVEQLTVNQLVLGSNPSRGAVGVIFYFVLVKKGSGTFFINTNCDIKRGRPFGRDSWIKKIAEKLGLASSLKQGGRPKKDT